MSKKTILIGTLALAAMSAFAAVAIDGFSIARKPKEGDVAKYTMLASVDFGGMDIKVKANVQEKVVKVESDGTYKVAGTQTDMKIEMNGQEQDGPNSDDATTTTFAANGDLKSIEGAQAGPDSYRNAILGVLHDPGKPVAVGDAWTYEVKKDDKTGVVAAKAEYKVLAEEKVGDWDALKLSMKVTETEGSSPAGSDGTVWISKADGSMIKTEVKWTNAPLPGAPAPINATVVITRVK